MKKLLPLTLLITAAFTGEAQEIDNAVITNSTFTASSFISDSEGWLADNNGKLWHTTNAALTWDSVSIQKNFNHMQFIDAQNGFALSTGGAFKTTDGGFTWSSIVFPAVHNHAIYFPDKNTGFISGSGEIYRTTDGGATWTTISTDSVSFTDFFFTGSDTGIASAHDDGSYQNLWRTTDGGLTWSNVHSEEKCYLNSVWFTDDPDGSGIGWAAGFYMKTGRGNWPIIMKTTDGGITWSKIYMNRYPGDIKGEVFTDIRFRNELEGFALSSFSESMITTDGGLTWELTYDANPALLPGFGIYKMLDGYSDIYFAGKEGNVGVWK